MSITGVLRRSETANKEWNPRVWRDPLYEVRVSDIPITQCCIGTKFKTVISYYLGGRSL